MGEKMRYPCQYCGCCHIWLAAFEPGQGVETWEKLITACVVEGCKIVGEEVENALV